MLVDTDILIWAIKREGSAIDYIDSLDEIYISDVTYMELMQGTRNKKELQFLLKTLEYIDVNRVHINAEISKKASELVWKYSHSHSMQLADALIAATAIVFDLPFSSGNKKHFMQLDELDLHVFTRS